MAGLEASRVFWDSGEPHPKELPLGSYEGPRNHEVYIWGSSSRGNVFSELLRSWEVGPVFLYHAPAPGPLTGSWLYLLAPSLCTSSPPLWAGTCLEQTLPLSSWHLVKTTHEHIKASQYRAGLIRTKCKASGNQGGRYSQLESQSRPHRGGGVWMELWRSRHCKRRPGVGNHKRSMWFSEAEARCTMSGRCWTGRSGQPGECPNCWTTHLHGVVS